MNIYKITNNINNKIYIGKDTTDDNYYYGSGILIKRAIDKYGKDNFTKEIVEELDDYCELSIREIHWINYYNSTNLEIGYNISSGGDGGDTISNHPQRDEICEKISKGSPKKGMTYEEAFGDECAMEYKRKLSENHPRLSIKELTGDYYETWLKNVRKVAESKKGKSIKENNNWNEQQYQEHLKKLSEKFSGDKNFLFRCDEEKRKAIFKKNRERAIKRRIDNINDFINKFNNGEINKYNYVRFNTKIRNWERDIGDNLYDYLPNDILNSYYQKCEEFKRENRKERKRPPKKEKVKKPVSENYYGNKSKKVSIDGVIYESVSNAAKSLNINNASLRYRLKSDSFNEYFYI